MVKRLTNDEFIKRSRNTHGDKYDYSKVEYINAQTKVCIICPVHGEFWQKPSLHLQHKGCMRCFLDKKSALFVARVSMTEITIPLFVASTQKVMQYGEP